MYDKFCNKPIIKAKNLDINNPNNTTVSIQNEIIRPVHWDSIYTWTTDLCEDLIGHVKKMSY